MAAETVVHEAPLYTGTFVFPMQPVNFVAVDQIGCYGAGASMMGGLALAEWSLIKPFSYDGSVAWWGTGDPGIDLDEEDSTGETVRDQADAARATMAGYAEQDFATYWLHRYYCQAGSPGEGGEAQWRWVVSCHVLDNDSNPVWVYGPDAMDLSWSLSVSDLRLWRDITADPPPKRQHMHPVDATARDYWVCGPDCQVVATIGGLTAACALDELDEGVIVTPIMMAGWTLSFGAQVAGVLDASTSYFHMGLGGGGAPLDAPAIDEQAFDVGLVTRVEEVDVVGGAGGWDLIPNAPYSGYALWGGTMHPPLIIGYDIDMKLFPGTAGSTSYDPLIWDGFQTSSGVPEPRLASSLPASIAIAQVSWGTGYLFKSDHQFAPRIDPDWADANLLNPGLVADVEGDEEILDDLYLGVHASPANKAPAADPWQTVGTLAAVNSPILPLLGSVAPIGDGVTVTGDAELALEVPDGITGGFELQLQTPYFERLALLGQLEVEKDWRWPYWLDKDGSQDAINWDSHAYLQLTTTRPLAGPLTLVMTVAYKEVAIYDPHYTSGAWRAREFAWSAVEREVTYTATLIEDQETITFDLLCPDDGSIPWLHIVETVTISGFEGPAEGEDAYLISAISLTSDPGSDHTGRDNGSAPRLLSKSIETWDFLRDWQGVLLQRDGCLHVARFPGEPWANEGPERGLGFIEATQHSPDYTGPASLLHFARPLTELGLLGGKQGLEMTWGAGYAAMHQDGEGRSIGTPMMYWASNVVSVEPATGQVWEVQAAPHVTRWSLALGVPYICRVRKVVGCGVHGLLKLGTGRMTQELLPEGARYHVFRRAGGDWTPIEEGDLVDHVDEHGIFESPGLLQGRSDETTIDHWIVLWADGGFAYDVTDPEDVAALRADPDYLHDVQLNGSTRRWSGLNATLAAAHGAGNLVTFRAGRQAIVRGGYVWIRRGPDEDWTRGTETTGRPGLLAVIPETDAVGRLERSGARKCAHFGIYFWVRGWLREAPPIVAAWASVDGDLTDLLLGPPDGLPLAAGVWPGSEICVLTAAGEGGYQQTRLGVVTPGSDQALWPLILRDSDGRWRVGVSTNTGWSQWRSTDLAGADWELEFDQAGPAEGLSASHLWRCADGRELLCGWRRTTADVVVLTRSGPGEAWAGPYLAEAADECHPYVTELPTGELECGWLLDETWTRRHADRPDATWS